MKKRILSLLLALVTVFYILPIGVIPTIALEGDSIEETGLSIEDMEVGKLYSAKFYADTVTPLARFTFKDTEELGSYPYLTELPQTLTVVRESGNNFDLVYVSDYVVENEIEWPEAYASYRYVSVDYLTIGDGITLDQMEIGKEYTATWSTDSSFIVVYKRLSDSASDYFVDYSYGKGDIENEFSIDDGFPKELIVERTYEGDLYEVYVTNEDWPSEYDDYRYVNWVDITITGEYTPPADDGYIYGKVGIFCEDAVDGTLTLGKGEKVHAFTSLDIEVSESAKYQWQIKVDEDRWATITDSIYPYAAISEALTRNAPDGRAELRCIVTDGVNKYASDKLVVELKENVEAYSSYSALANADGDTSDGNEGITTSGFEIKISYVFRHALSTGENGINDTTAQNSFSISLPENSSYTGTVTYPPVFGYTPYVYLGTELPEGETLGKNGVISYWTGEGDTTNLGYYKAQSTYAFDKQSQKFGLTVYYIPNLVDFAVIHYEQNIQNDEYMPYNTLIHQGYTDAPVGSSLVDEDKLKNGFTALFYDPNTTISASGTTIEIYYDRVYYLVGFELNGGYGVSPYYVRYGTQISLGEPTKPGYTLVNDKWTLTSVYTVTTDIDGNEIDRVEYDDTSDEWVLYLDPSATTTLTIKHNLFYTANWKEAESKYTIVYWLEHTDSTDSTNPENYDVWYTVLKSANTEDTTIAVGDNIKDQVTTANNMPSSAVTDVTKTHPYLTYMESMDDSSGDVISYTGMTEKVAGDGTTAINIYYSRNIYTLKFYYAIEKQSGGSSTYYVIGGTTHGFGSAAGASVYDDEVSLIRQYAYSNSTYVAQTGQVTEKPSLNDVGSDRKYTISYDTEINSGITYNYLYISFSAKFGADISDKWPCAVFNSATTTQTYNKYDNPDSYYKNLLWSGNTATVSAWNGEHHVKYTQDHKGDNDNQTIKGKYSLLDENVLWSSTYGKSNIVAYACFWENGANINWSKPELYRYNIWLPLLDGQDETGLITTEYDGVKYYRADVYDTCDNSQVSEQTQPALIGYTANIPNNLTSVYDYDTITDFNDTVYDEAYDVHFYYKRNDYQLSYNDGYGNTESLDVPYGTSLNTSTYTKTEGPVYPSALEVGEKTFGGWYIDEACQIPFEFTVTDSEGNVADKTMPANNIQLYAKWNDVSYEVEVYLDVEQNNPATPKDGTDFPVTVIFGDRIAEPDRTNENNNYIFAGWYYKENGTEKRFDFNTMTIKKNYVKDEGTAIYAKWTSQVPVPYVVYYQIKDAEGNYIDIAEPTKGEALAGTHKTFNAKTGAQLYTDYQKGFYPSSRSETLAVEDSNDESVNVIRFVYSKPSEVKYTVNHVFISDDFTSIIGDNSFEFSYVGTISNAENASASIEIEFSDGVTKSEIIKKLESDLGMDISLDNENEIWNIILNLSPNAFKQDLTLVYDGSANAADNTVAFTWKGSGTTGIYQVVHHFQSLTDPTVYVPSATQEFVGNYGDKYWATPMTVTGFEVDTDRSGNNIKDPGLTFEKLSTDPDTGEVTGGLVLNVYYKRLPYYYKVIYNLYNKNGVTIEEKEIVEDGETKKVFEVPYETVVTEVAPAFTNYYLVSAEEQTYKITTGTSIAPYEIVFNYMIFEVNYYYQVVPGTAGYIENNYYTETVESGGIPKGAVPIANKGWVFEGWYTDPECTVKVLDTSATVDEGTNKINPVIPSVDKDNVQFYFYAKFIPTTRKFTNVNIAEGQAVIYRLQGKSTDDNTKNVDITFVIIGSNSVTLAMLPYGDYTLTVTDWSWRYADPTIGFNNGTVTGSDGTYDLSLTVVGDVTFTFGASTNDQWLTDDANDGSVTPTTTP